MKIEHWQSQAEFPNQQLVYANLLGACKGGEGGHPNQRHCDTWKGGQRLKWNPATPAHAIESRVKYRNNGEIRSDDPQFDSELDTVLNLNIAVLKNSRKGILDGVLQWWHKKNPNKTQIQAQVNKYDGRNGALQPFVPVALWFLKRKLAA